MVVGEPTLMGGEFGDKDERLIARLENTQYEMTDTEFGIEMDQQQQARLRGMPAGGNVNTSGYRPGGQPHLQQRGCPYPGSPPLHDPWANDKVTSQQLPNAPHLGNSGGSGSGSDDKFSNSAE